MTNTLPVSDRAREWPDTPFTKFALKLAEAHDRAVGEGPEHGAALAYRCANGIAVAYWNAIARAAAHPSLEREIIQSTADRVAELEAALTKCRAQFAFYAEHHREKADRAKQEADEATGYDTYKILTAEANKRRQQLETNEQFVTMIDAALKGSSDGK